MWQKCKIKTQKMQCMLCLSSFHRAERSNLVMVRPSCQPYLESLAHSVHIGASRGDASQEIFEYEMPKHAISATFSSNFGGDAKTVNYCMHTIGKPSLLSANTTLNTLLAWKSIVYSTLKVQAAQKCQYTKHRGIINESTRHMMGISKLSYIVRKIQLVWSLHLWTCQKHLACELTIQQNDLPQLLSLQSLWDA